ncbi:MULTISPECIES: ribonuclease HII [unclassified Saccharopolyspora]|uniref:ribonuclease HII n=1 Tax=unclassified Saccharopolyspora TaxID=2646250 RepID=UPI001CD36007|nr:MULTISPECIES: ribonuclease HII [unclassified Saccharopolyspora]MCA1187520.1 ribonuclease HII [Saccharopolyspora sp. 6T]MCA1195946.1 ribonuclease HII [Saccharopolyspora sp. 6V]MCA1228187.1 ribonuclease HII [Saccharopolyspora sp. 6M]
MGARLAVAGAGWRPPRPVIRRSSGNWALQSAVDRSGLGPVAGVDEAGRGACAGPLVVASCVLRPGDARRFEGLTDSKVLTEAERERLHEVILRRAEAHSTVVIDAEDVDALGIHVANLEGMRRAVARLPVHPGYVLTDGFKVQGLGAPSVAVLKGDLVAACVAAASVLAKVTRDHIMRDLHERWPRYGFAAHKGYCTADHTASMRAHGPCAEHRWSYSNVVAAARLHGMRSPRAIISKPGLFDASEGEVVDNGRT